MTSIQALPVILTCVVLLASTAGAAAVPQAPPASTQESCGTAVLHDEFRTDNHTIEAIANGTAQTSTKRNTRVTVDDSDGFYEVTGENPNGYCVEFTVEIAAAAFPAAKLPGTVDSNSGNHTATWDAVYDFNESQMYTQVVFTLPAGSKATFAPNEVRVESLSWVSEKATRGESTWASIKTKVFGEETLEKHRYALEVEESSFDGGKQAVTVTVPLRHPQTNEPLEEWYAMYTVDGGETWRPIKEETTAPVYRSGGENDSVARFTFTDPEAEVEFVANPDRLDKAKREYRSYMAGAQDLVEKLLPGGEEDG